MNRQIAAWITHRWVKWVALIVLLPIIGGLASLSSKLISVQENDQVNWLPANAESTQVVQKAKGLYDEQALPVVLVYERKDGVTPADLAAVEADMARVAAVKEISDAGKPLIGPVVSQDKQAIQVIATVHLDPKDGWSKLPDTFDEVKKAAHSTDGLTVEFAGPVAATAGLAKAFGQVDGKLLLTAAIVVVLMLLLTYRSPVLWLWPILCGLASVGSASGLVYLLAKHANVTVNGQTQIILSILVLGASVDYALLLVARYREELHNFENPHQAMSHALHRAAPAIVASGLTVALAMVCLLAAEMNSTSSLGPVLAVGILVALVLMLVLLPAMLLTLFPISLVMWAVLGLPLLALWLMKGDSEASAAAAWHARLWAVLANRRWIFWPFVPHFGSPDRQASGLWAKVGQRVAKAPRPVWVVTAALLAVASFGILQLHATGLASDEQFVGHPAFLDAAKTQAAHFPAGAGSPVQIIAKAGSGPDVKDALMGVDGVVPDSVSLLQRGDVAYLEATLSAGGGSHLAKDTIDRVRDAVHQVKGADALVGGQDAILDDTEKASMADSWHIIPIVLAVILIVLIVLLRAILAPVILLATVLLSFGAAVGISALVFHNILNFAGADSSYPLWVFVFLVALGVDYNIFLMTRVREESLEHGTRKGSLIAVAATGGVITSAGLVLAGTFGAMATLPLVFTAELGLTVALGVLLDTFIVRSVLVTALNLDIGRHLWWPSKLAQKTDDAEPEPELASLPAR
jgi:RND superfamily putative drug exporter